MKIGKVGKASEQGQMHKKVVLVMTTDGMGHRHVGEIATIFEDGLKGLISLRLHRPLIMVIEIR